MRNNILSAAKEFLKYSELSHLTIAKNISQANKPAAKALEVEEFNFNKLINKPQIRLNTTSNMHITGANKPNNYRVRLQRDAYETTPMGNNIVLEEQMLKLNANHNDFQLASSLYKKINGLLRLTTNNLK